MQACLTFQSNALFRLMYRKEITATLRNCPDCDGRVAVDSVDFQIACRHCGKILACEDGLIQDRDAQLQYREEFRVRLLKAREENDYSAITPVEISQIAAHITLTTESSVVDRQIQCVLEVISAECCYGVRVFDQIVSGGSAGRAFRGRSKEAQDTLRNARKTTLAELRREALMVGADAVIGVSLDYHEITGSVPMGKIMFVASGTAVKLK